MNVAGRQEFLGVPAVLESPAIRQVVALTQRVAGSNVAVLITGETGSGKEIVARAIHHFSLRCGRPWVDINCGALPDQLMESELFGHEKGAFSGAETAKPGLFEMANGGTLFLDEVGELDARM
ncbi:MAG TPA: sigma 54-interacting transcriptional regulator, partial [Bryobacteraceae bacterium]